EFEHVHRVSVDSFVFFFSSRRRHTRSKRDWSSDVCSSDLLLSNGGNMDIRHLTKGAKLYLPVWVEGALFSIGDTHAAQGDGEVRSEERRVGKEGRSKWGQDQ